MVSVSRHSARMKHLVILVSALLMALGCTKTEATGQAAGGKASAPSAPAPSAPSAAANVVAAPGSVPTQAASAAPAPAPLPTMSVGDVDAMLQAKSGVAVDANGPETRKAKGIVPGAILLSDYEMFDVKELGPDKSRLLVFYCGSEQCTASHDAARRALALGYTNVKIMSAGIAGWLAAGKTAATI